MCESADAWLTIKSRSARGDGVDGCLTGSLDGGQVSRHEEGHTAAEHGMAKWRVPTCTKLYM